MMELPLKGLIVLEFSQYLSGPSAALRLADLGARVIKIEKPNGGDAGRKLAIKIFGLMIAHYSFIPLIVIKKALLLI